MYDLGLSPGDLYNALLRFPFNRLRIKGNRSDKKLRFLLKRCFLSLSDVDWRNTRAYAIGSGLIRINMKGREPSGIVCPGTEFENLKREITCVLKDLRDPKTGENVVERIYTKEEIYYGSSLASMPDLILLPKNGYMTFEEHEFGSHNVFTKAETVTGCHRLNGILLMKGPQLNKGKALEAANIMDLAPTVLYLLGLKIPLNMDGKVLSRSLASSYLIHNPVRFSREKVEKPFFGEKKEVWHSEEDEQTIRIRLGKLGYM
jgi:hypothetical protein